MIGEALVADLTRLGLAPKRHEPLSRHGYWRIGGPADLWVEVHHPDQLSALIRLGAPVTVLGNGSNLLVSDAGIRGVAVRLSGTFKEARITPLPHPTVEAGAGLLNAVLLKRIEARGLCGLAPLAGVPGTVGGAIRLNAGTALGEIGDKTINIKILDINGMLQTLHHDDLGFRYRHAAVPTGAVIVSATFRLSAEGLADEQAAIAHHLARRKATQPLDLPSCGSVFKNPPGGFAGALIESVGLKGARRGDAMISEKHANFIVNLGAARASDVAELIALARATVLAERGVRLDPEVHVTGDWAEPPWPELSAT